MMGVGLLVIVVAATFALAPWLLVTLIRSDVPETLDTPRRSRSPRVADPSTGPVATPAHS